METNKEVIMQKFVKFTDFYTSNPIICNLEDISSFYKTQERIPNESFPRSCTKIIMKNNVKYTVSEELFSVIKTVLK